MTHFSPYLYILPFDEIDLRKPQSMGAFAAHLTQSPLPNLLNVVQSVGVALTIPIRIIKAIWNGCIAILTSVLYLVTMGQVKSISDYMIKAWKDTCCEAYSAVILTLVLPAIIVCHLVGAIFAPAVGRAGWEALMALVPPIRWLEENNDAEEDIAQRASIRHLEDQAVQRITQLRQAGLNAEEVNRVNEIVHTQELNMTDPAFRRTAQQSEPLLKTLEEGLYSDIKIIVKVDDIIVEYLAHKAVLVSRSDFFRSMLMSKMQESQSDKITLHLDDPTIIEGAEDKASIFDRFLHYLYSYEVDLSDLSGEQLLRVGSLANQYFVPSLRIRCGAELNRKINAEMSLDDLVTLWAGCKAYNMDGIAQTCIRELCHRINDETLEQISVFAEENALEIVKSACQLFNEETSDFIFSVDRLFIYTQPVEQQRDSLTDLVQSYSIQQLISFASRLHRRTRMNYTISFSLNEDSQKAAACVLELCKRINDETITEIQQFANQNNIQAIKDACRCFLEQQTFDVEEETDTIASNTNVTESDDLS